MRPAGFTLIEVMLAMLIMAMISLITWSALTATFRTQATVSEKTGLQDLGTATLVRVQEDIRQAFYVQAPQVYQQTFFRGENNFDQDKLSFTSMSHAPVQLEAKESDQTEITYTMESDSKRTGVFRLLRRETRYPSKLQGRPRVDERGDAVTVADGVVVFNLEYSDGQEFQSAWSTDAPEHQHQLPKAVKVTLKIKDEKEREATFEALIDLPMSEDLSVQIAPAAPSAPPGGPSVGQQRNQLGRNP